MQILYTFILSLFFISCSSDTVNKELNETADFNTTLESNISSNTNKSEETPVVEKFTGNERYTFDFEGNKYIADSLNNRIVKLTKASNFTTQENFIDAIGSAKGELSNPLDISFSTYHSKPIFYVLDAGNRRIQIFNHVGAYLADFEAEGESMAGSSDIIVCNNKKREVIKMHYNFLTHQVSREKLYTLKEDAHVSLSSEGIILTQAKKTLYLQLDGKVIKEIKNSKLAPARTSSSVTALSKKFVEAYTQKDEATLLSITDKALLQKLEGKKELLHTLFTNVENYEEYIYFNNQKAKVTLTIKQNAKEFNLQFYFVWTKNRWQLKEIV